MLIAQYRYKESDLFFIKKIRNEKVLRAKQRKRASAEEETITGAGKKKISPQNNNGKGGEAQTIEE